MHVFLYRKKILSTDDYNYLSATASDYAKMIASHKATYLEKCSVLVRDYLLGDLMRKNSISRHNKVNIKINNFGKPFFEKPVDYYFNFSHNKEYEAIVFGNKPVGVDVEKFDSFNLDTQSLFVSEGDNIKINDHKMFLCKIWTAKESYCKAVGRGLNVSLKKINVIEKNNFYKISNDGQDSDWLVKQVVLSEGTVVSVCSLGDFLLEYELIDIKNYL